MSNPKCNDSAGALGRGPELKYEFYFPPNRCMPKDIGMGKCPSYPYPLQNIPTCKSIYEPCQSNVPYGVPETALPNPIPSELYGDVLKMNGGDGGFYYDNHSFDLPVSNLTLGSDQQAINFILRRHE
jgi:hypothetical protein